MSTWKVILATLVIFCTGFFAGVLFPRNAGQVTLSKAATPPAPPLPSDRRLEALRRLTQNLELTVEQKDKIESHIQDSQDRTRLIWELMGPEVQEEFRRLRGLVVDELSMEQRKKFEENSRRNRRADRNSRSATNPSPAGLAAPVIVPRDDVAPKAASRP